MTGQFGVVGNADCSFAVVCGHHDARHQGGVVAEGLRQVAVGIGYPALIDVGLQVGMAVVEDFSAGGERHAGFELGDVDPFAAVALSAAVVPDRQYVDVVEVPLVGKEGVGGHVGGFEIDLAAHLGLG